MVNYKDLGLVNTKEMFAKAIKGGYAIPAFNFNNMEQMQAIIKAAVETKSPVILQVSKGARQYANATLLRYMAQGAVEYAKELGCPSASALTFWLLLGQAKSDTSDLIRRLRIGTAPFLHRRPEYRHLEQRSLLAQQRVPSCPVQYGIGRRESRHDSPYMRSLDLGGGRYPLLRDEAVIDGSEP